MSIKDVLAVHLKTGKVRILAHNKDEENAEAVVAMAVMRRGVEDEFFVAVPSNSYSEGELWRGQP